MKRAVTIRWLSLHASAKGVYDEYEVLLETLNLLAEGKRSEVVMTKDSAKY